MKEDHCFVSYNKYLQLPSISLGGVLFSNPFFRGPFISMTLLNIYLIKGIFLQNKQKAIKSFSVITYKQIISEAFFSYMYCRHSVISRRQFSLIMRIFSGAFFSCKQPFLSPNWKIWQKYRNIYCIKRMLLKKKMCFYRTS